MSEVLPPGAEIANYRISRVVGRGGMGVVYLAEHIHLGRMAALKTISGVHAETPEFRERFVRESRLAAQIDHPHIVPIYDAGEADGQLYLAMRLIDGEDLDQLNEREAPLDPARVLDVFAQVAAALDAAHAQGLVHRDVKPANVLLEPTGSDGGFHAYLADFGLTKHAGTDSGLTVTGQVMGTVFYVAPEQIEGRDIDGRADQYSLGCMLFECLTGSRPFDSDGQLLAILNAHVNHPRPPVSAHRPDLPAAIDAVVARALSVSPDERFATCAEFVAAAREAVEAGRADGSAAPVAPATESTDGRAAHTAPGVGPPPPRPEAEPGGAPAPPSGARPRRGRVVAAALVGVVVLAGAVAAATVLWPTGDGNESTAELDGDAASETVAEENDEGGQDPAGEDAAAEAAAEPTDQIVFTSTREGDNDIFRMEPDGSGMINLTEGSDSDDRQATWSRDRDRIVFASDRTGEFAIHVMEPDGGNATQVTSGEGRDLDPRFSPDGERIAFSSQRDDSRSIWVIDVDGTDLEQLTDAGGEDMRPTWSNDGTQLAFHRRHGADERLDIFVKEADLDAEPVNVTDRPANDFHPSWAPAEPLVAFASDHDGAEDIFTVEVTGVVDGDEPGTPRNLTESAETDDLDPNWSPDANWITFQRGRGENTDVYIMRADGSDVRPLTDSDAADGDPGW